MAEVADNPENKASSRKVPGIILVSDVPSELSQNDIWIYFQQKKNSGGEVLDVLMKTDRHEAVVYFEDYKVAEAIAQRQDHVVKRHAVGVKLFDVNKDKQTRTVEVSGLPTDVTKERLKNHFKKKEYGGGEIEDVNLLGTGKALVVFRDLEVAKNIINTEQPFKGKVLDLNPMATESNPTKTIRGATDVVKEGRTILVSGLPEGVAKNTVHIHFQRKKNNGGEVEDTVLLPEGKTAWVIFEDPKVAENVLKKEQKIQGKLVRVKLFTTKTKTTERVEELRTILVSNLPGGETENSITTHFQEKANGGGKVEKVQLSPDGKEAQVTFVDPKVAQTAVSKPQNIRKTLVSVTLLGKKKEFVQEIPSKIVPNPEGARTPPVGSPSEVTVPEITETPRKEVKTQPVATANQQFETEGLQSEPKREETMYHNAKPLDIQKIDPVFYMVTATVNPMLMNTGSEYFWSNVFNKIQRSCGVQCHVTTLGVMLTGSLSQVTRAGEIIEHQWRENYQHLQFPNVNNTNLFNESGINFNQPGRNFNQPGRNFNQPGTNFNQPGTNFNQPATNFNQTGANFSQPGTNFNHPGMNFNQPGTNFNQPGTNFNQTGANFSQSGTSVDQNNKNLKEHDAPGNFANTAQIFDARCKNQFNQGNPLHQGCQQSGLMITPYDHQSSYSAHDHGRCVNQAPHPQRKPPGFQHDTTRPQQFGNPQNVYPQYFFPSPYINPHSEEAPRSVNNSGNVYLFLENEQYTHPQFRAQPPFESERNLHSVQPPTPVDSTGNSQPFEKRSLLSYTANLPNSTIISEREQVTGGEINPPGATIVNDTGTENATLKTDGMFQPSPPIMLDRFPNGSRSPQLSVNNQLASSTTSNNNFVPPTNGKTYSQREKPPISLTGTTNHPPSIKNQESTRSSSSTESKTSSTSSYKTVLSSNDATEFQSEKTPTSAQSTINHQLPVNQQDCTKVITTPGAEIVTTFSSPSGPPRSKQPDSNSEKPPGLPETTINPQRQNNDPQGLSTAPENSVDVSFSNDLNGLQEMFGQLNINTPTGQPQPGVTTPEPPSNDQEKSTKIPDNQPQLNQQQTVINQQTTTPKENLNPEPSPNNPSASKPSAKPQKAIEQPEHSKNAERPKKTPTPRPRQKKPQTNESRNAATFSNAPVKPTQTEQENLAPNEQHTNSVQDDVNATNKPNEGEQLHDT